MRSNCCRIAQNRYGFLAGAEITPEYTGFFRWSCLRSQLGVQNPVDSSLEGSFLSVFAKWRLEIENKKEGIDR